jgi:WD40 repeat protein/tRNA A-37 threonylcarbamoyl transferase component Bud32
LKTIQASALADPRRLQRFRIEAEAMARLKHPNIIPIYQVGEFDEQPYFTMEFMDGGDLQVLIDRVPPTPREAALLVETLARAVHYAHQQGVIHRDLKPGNILLSLPVARPGGNGVVRASSYDPTRAKITDFGLARVLDEEDTNANSLPINGQPAEEVPHSRLTRTHDGMGSLGYLSIEQATGRVDDVIGTLSDVYSLGAILYRMLTGHTPYEGATLKEVIAKMMSEHEDIPPPRQWRSDLPRDLELICLKCLAREPAKRYASAEQLAIELRCFLDGEPPRCTRPVGRGERAWCWVKRNRAWAAISGLAATLLAVTIVGSIYFAVNENLHAHVVADALRESQLRLAENYLLQGIAHCKQGSADLGVIELAQSLQEAPADAADLQYVIRMNLAGWGRQISPLRSELPHPNAVVAGAFSPNSKTVVTACVDQSVRLWDVDSAEPVGKPFPHPARVLAAAFSPDGKTILTGCADGTIRRWEVASGQASLLKLNVGGEVSVIAFSGDGEIALTADKAGKIAQLWKTSTGEAIGSPLPQQHTMLAAAFSPDGQTILLADALRNAQFWKVTTAKRYGPLIHHPDRMYAVAISSDGKTVLTGGTNKTAQLWNAATGTPLGQPLVHMEGVFAVAVSPDGRTILTGSSDRSARLWTALCGKDLCKLLPHESKRDVGAAAFSPDGSKVVTGSYDNTARIWEAATGNLLMKFLGHSDRVVVALFSPDGRTVLTGSCDNTACLWDVATGNLLFNPLQHEAHVAAAAFSPDGNTILTGSTDHQAHLWNATTGTLLRTFSHEDGVSAVAFSPDGRTILTGSGDKTVCLWDPLPDPPLRMHTFPHMDRVAAAIFSPDGRSVLTGNSDASASLWDTASGALRGRLQHGGIVRAVAYSPEGRYALTGSGDNTAQLWDAATGRPFGRPLQHTGEVCSVAVSPDGRSVLTGSWDKTAQLWDLASGIPLGPPIRHDGIVWKAVFSPDGRTVLTGSGDNFGRLFAIPSPARGEVHRLVLWAQVISRMEADEGLGGHILDSRTWQTRRQELSDLGGLPED